MLLSAYLRGGPVGAGPLPPNWRGRGGPGVNLALVKSAKGGKRNDEKAHGEKANGEKANGEKSKGARRPTCIIRSFTSHTLEKALHLS